MENFPSSFSQIRPHTSNTYREARHKVFGSATYPSSGLRAVLLTRSGSYLVEWPAIVGNVVVLNHTQKQITFFSSLKKNNTSQYVQNFRAYGRQEEKGMTEDEMVGWHHRREFE